MEWHLSIGMGRAVSILDIEQLQALDLLVSVYLLH